MEFKSLLLGLAFTVGIFAVKSGVGLSYLLLRQRGWSHILTVITSFCLCYGLMFLLTWFIVSKVNFLDHLTTFMTFFKGGMIVHFIFAVLLFGWGVRLLTRQAVTPSRAWLLLVIPCPVCFTVFLSSTALMDSISGGNPWAMVMLFGGYIFVSGITATVLYYFRPDHKEHMLGSFMVVAALYFLLTVIIVPHFSDIERIYHLSSGKPFISPDGWELCKRHDSQLLETNVEITALLTSFIYLISSSLLIPVLLVLSGAIIWLLVYTGSFWGSWLQRKQLSSPSDPVTEIRSNSLGKFSLPVRNFVAKLSELQTHEQREAATINLLRETELRLWKSLDNLKILVRIGPGLGLIGTLVPMVTGLVSYCYFTVQRRWVEDDIKI
jgi:predicted transporter